MSSTYAHYQQPSSLPQDYALLSRYAAAHGVEDASSNYSADDDHNNDDEFGPHSLGARRDSHSSAYLRPPKPTIGQLPPQNYVPTETSPLLQPLVPIIREEADNETIDNPNVTNMSMFWEELRILARYALPVFGTHLLEYSLVMASVISIGHLGTTSLAAITLGSMTASVTGFSIIQGFTSALDTMLPSAWTSPQPQLVGLWSQRMAVVMAATLVPIYAIWFNAYNILVALKQEPEVAALAAVYLRWVSIGLPGYAFNGISRRYFQSQGLFTIPTRIIFIVAPINVVLNYLLVWGPDAIRLGYIGAPIATAMSFNLVSLLSIIYGYWYVPRTAWMPFSRRAFTSLGVLVQLGLAGVGQTASEWWAWELVALAASMLGPVTLAAQSVLLVSASTTFQAPFALSVAASVRIGNLLGEGNALRAKITSNTSLVAALGIAALWSSMFLAFRKSWGYIFNDDPEVVTLVASILPLVALFQVFDGNAAVTGGIFRARGKQFSSALLNLSAYYVIGIPLGCWLAFSPPFGIKPLGVHGLWIGLTVSLVYCSFFGTWLNTAKTDWNREVFKVQERLKAAAEEDRAKKLNNTNA